MIYLYRDVQTGEQVEVIRPMQSMPDDLELDGRTLRRVYTTPHVGVKQGEGVNYGKNKLPTSRSLPFATEPGEPATLHGHAVKKLKCGAYATEDGARIVDSADAAKRHAADTNTYWEKS